MGLSLSQESTKLFSESPPDNLIYRILGLACLSYDLSHLLPSPFLVPGNLFGPPGVFT